MPAEILPAASLRNITRLPAARVVAGVSNPLIEVVLRSIGRAIFGAKQIFSLLSGRGRRSSAEIHPCGGRRRQPLVECGNGGEQRPAARQHDRSGNLVRSAAGFPDDQQSGKTIPGLDVRFVIRFRGPLGDHRERHDAGAHAAQRAAAAQCGFDHFQRRIGGRAAGETDKDRRLGEIADRAGLYRYAVAGGSLTANGGVELAPTHGRWTRPITGSPAIA